MEGMRLIIADVENRAFLPVESILRSRHGRVFYVKSSAQVDENGLQSPSARHDGDQQMAAGLEEDQRWNSRWLPTEVSEFKTVKRLNRFHHYSQRKADFRYTDWTSVIKRTRQRTARPSPRQDQHLDPTINSDVRSDVAYVS